MRYSRSGVYASCVCVCESVYEWYVRKSVCAWGRYVRVCESAFLYTAMQCAFLACNLVCMCVGVYVSAYVCVYV